MTVARDPDKVFNLAPVPTEELVAELARRGIELAELPWEDCGECEHVRKLSEAGICGAKRKPTWFPEGLHRTGDPREVGFYALACPARIPMKAA